MRTTESLKKSISSATDLLSVTRTMKTLAAVNIRQYEAAVESLQEYHAGVQSGMGMLLRQGVELDESAMFRGERTGVVMFGSDQGMCGAFNEQVAHFAADVARSQTADAAPILCVGHRAADALQEIQVPIESRFALPGSVEGTTSLVHRLLPAIDRWRATHRLGHIVLVHNRRHSASAWKPHAATLLPLDRSLFSTPDQGQPSATSSCLPFWTMDTNVLFSRLVRQFLFVSLFRACAESQAGENASRIAAMQSADRSITERIQQLTAEHAQTRQNAITEELLDVVTGFEALHTAVDGGTQH